MPLKHVLPCRSVDPEIFFPVGNIGPAQVQIDLAKTLCQPCPIIQQCRDYALTHAIEFGVWGGLSETERRAIRRRRSHERIRYAEGAPLIRELASA